MLMSSMGRTWAYPPPAAPPLIPNTGPRLGWRRTTMFFVPMWPIAWARPTAIVVLPSPVLVGVTAVTMISFPSGLSFLSLSTLGLIFALYFP